MCGRKIQRSYKGNSAGTRGTEHSCVYNPRPDFSEFVVKPFGIGVNSNTHGE